MGDPGGVAADRVAARSRRPRPCRSRAPRGPPPRCPPRSSSSPARARRSASRRAGGAVRARACRREARSSTGAAASSREDTAAPPVSRPGPSRGHAGHGPDPGRRWRRATDRRDQQLLDRSMRRRAGRSGRRPRRRPRPAVRAAAASPRVRTRGVSSWPPRPGRRRRERPPQRGVRRAARAPQHRHLGPRTVLEVGPAQQVGQVLGLGARGVEGEHLDPTVPDPGRRRLRSAEGLQSARAMSTPVPIEAATAWEAESRGGPSGAWCAARPRGRAADRRWRGSDGGSA